MRVGRFWTIAIAIAASLALSRAEAQTPRCEPTLANPCKPTAPEQKPNAANEPQKRPATRLDPVSPIPEIKLNRDTTMGVGQGGGIIGLERKF